MYVCCASPGGDAVIVWAAVQVAEGPVKIARGGRSRAPDGVVREIIAIEREVQDADQWLRSGECSSGGVRFADRRDDRVSGTSRRCGLNTELCCAGCNVPPFEAMESPDVKNGRLDWVRSECRLCGRLLGFRPKFEATRSQKAANETLAFTGGAD